MPKTDRYPRPPNLYDAKVDNTYKAKMYDYLCDYLDEEHALREKHPSLQNAWDQYQTMLQLVKEDK